MKFARVTVVLDHSRLQIMELLKIELRKGLFIDMKKLAALLIILALGSTFVGCQNGMQDDPHSSDQSTNIETSQPVKNEVFLQSEVIETTPYGTTRYQMEYDSMGRLITQTVYADGQDPSVYTYTYDAFGYLNSDTRTGSIEYAEQWENDEDGRILSGSVVIKSSFGTTKTSYTYQYDENGRVSVYTRTSEAGEITQKKEYEYIDSNGSYSVTETGAGMPTQTTTYMIDPQGNLVEQTTKSGDREISQIKYDAYGNVIQSVANGVVTKSENIYDRELLTQVKVFDEEGNLMQQRVNTYDQNNMLVLSVITDASGTVISQTEIKYTLCVIEQE